MGATAVLALWINERWDEDVCISLMNMTKKGGTGENKEPEGTNLRGKGVGAGGRRVVLLKDVCVLGRQH
jgi:hypothetical protein